MKQRCRDSGDEVPPKRIVLKIVNGIVLTKYSAKRVSHLFGIEDEAVVQALFQDTSYGCFSHSKRPIEQKNHGSKVAGPAE